VERFGLDFGTTNTSLAWARGDGPPVLCDLDSLAPDPRVLRSLLYWSLVERDLVSGQRAIAQYLAEDMQGRLIQSMKTFLADDSFEDTWIHDRFWTLEELIAVLFRHVRAAIRARADPDDVRLVVGRPAIFVHRPEREALARERVRRAAARAGFVDLGFEYEPIAAGRAYEASLDRPETALIADLGGGTADFTVMRLGTGARGDRRDDILATGGVQVGGDVFDGAVMTRRLARHFGGHSTYRSIHGTELPFPAHVVAQLGRWHQVAFLRGAKVSDLLGRVRWTSSDPDSVDRLEALIEGNHAFALFEAIERAKSALSVADVARIRFAGGGITIDEPLARTDFETLIAPDVARIERCLAAVMDAARLGPDDVDSVFLTGGTAQIPALRALFTRAFGADKLRAQDYFTTVACGLALA
jgi:hypothetical chaperone protein